MTLHPPGKFGTLPALQNEPAKTADIGRLIIRGEDRPGIVAAVSNFLSRAGANIVSLDQFSTDAEGGSFFQRTVFHLAGLSAARQKMEEDFRREVAQPMNLDFDLVEASRLKRVAIMVSNMDHCIMDLLWRQRRGELAMDVVMIIGNHAGMADSVRPFGVPFFHVPISKDTKAEAEHATSTFCAAMSIWLC